MKPWINRRLRNFGLWLKDHSLVALLLLPLLYPLALAVIFGSNCIACVKNTVEDIKDVRLQDTMRSHWRQLTGKKFNG